MLHGTTATAHRKRQALLVGLTANVFLVGLVSFLTDASSEMIVPLLPIFVALAGVGHGVSAPVIIGLLEGLAEAASALLKPLAGAWTDRTRRKKPLILLGYGISSLARPLMGLAAAWWHPVAVRLVDRLGKGIRTAPRDVLIAESTPAEHRGKAFGFHRSMDHLGAVLGPLVAVGLLFVFYRGGLGDAAKESALRTIFLLSAIPGVICLAVIAFWIRDVGAPAAGAPFRFAWRSFSARYWYYLASLFVFTLGNSTDLFLVYRASELIRAEHALASQGVMAMAMTPLLWAFFHAFKTFGTAPLGSLSDRVGRRTLIRLGWGVYALVYLGFAFMNHSWQAWPLFAVYALYYALTEGAEKALIVDLAPPDLRGTAVGMFHLTVGVAALPASIIFGLVYARLGALTAFGYSALLALGAVILLSATVRETAAAGRPTAAANGA